MRAALALAAVAATSIVGVAAAAPAEATGCTVGAAGYRVTDLRLHHGVSCELAHNVVHHGLRTHAHQIGWTCRHDSFDHRYFFFSCWANDGSGRWLTFTATYA